MPNNGCYAVFLRFKCEALLIPLGDWGVPANRRIPPQNSDKTIEGLEKLAKGRYPNLQANMAYGSISF